MRRRKIRNRIVIAVVLVALVIGGVWFYRKYINPPGVVNVTDEMRAKVSERREYTYPNKFFEGQSLEGKTAKEITSILKAAVNKRNNRKAYVIIDKEENLYSMDELHEKVTIKCSDGKSFDAGREDAAAKYIVNSDKNLSVPDQIEIIDGDREATKFDVEIACESDSDMLNELMKDYQVRYDKPAKNATMTVKLKVKKEKSGKVLDTAAINQDLTQYLDSNIETDFKKEYATTEVKPEIKASYLKKINTKIGGFATRFITTNARGRNIKKAVNRLAGKMLDPGEEMSFLNVLYDDSDGEIYEESGGFLENQVVQVEGGGICQVSTTAYGAFLRAGIIPVERHPHTCRVPYAPMGLDAALAIGTKDMVIKNTLKQPIFIQAYVKKQWLYINIISTKNATKGYTYIPRVKADKKNLTAESFLDVKKKGKKIKTIKLSEDSYKKVSG